VALLLAWVLFLAQRTARHVARMDPSKDPTGVNSS
jgi:hypothetical protein